jgi:hypothetical protein
MPGSSAGRERLPANSPMLSPAMFNRRNREAATSRATVQRTKKPVESSFRTLAQLSRDFSRSAPRALLRLPVHFRVHFGNAQKSRWNLHSVQLCNSAGSF